LPAEFDGAGENLLTLDVGGVCQVQHKFFVELWDVSGQEKYQQLRSVFYKHINGVILVYDLTNPGQHHPPHHMSAAADRLQTKHAVHCV